MKFFVDTINTLSYDEVYASKLMEKRGIKYPNESFESVFIRVINNLISEDTKLNNGIIDKNFLEQVIKLTESKTIIYSTPLLMNIGRANYNSLGACTVLRPLGNDGKFDPKNFKMRIEYLLFSGVGTGFDLSGLTNPIEIIHDINKLLIKIDNQLARKNRRPSASILTLRVDHPMILEFIKVKNDADFSNSKFNISVFVDEKLFNAAKNNKELLLKDSKGQVVNTIIASKIINSIATSAHFCGEPGILFKDRFEYDNPTPQLPYISTAPCAELAMTDGDMCHFGYINLNSLITYKNNKPEFDFILFSESVKVLTRLLDSAVQISINSNSEILNKIAARRRIGIGIAGFASLLITLGIPYDSERAVNLAAKISESLDFYSKIESMRLAKVRGPFPEFINSRYMNRSWLQRKLINCTGIIDKRDWLKLYN